MISRTLLIEFKRNFKARKPNYSLKKADVH